MTITLITGEEDPKLEPPSIKDVLRGLFLLTCFWAAFVAVALF